MFIIIVEQNQHTRKGKLTHVCVCDYEKPVCVKTITINETKEKFFYCRGLIRVGGEQRFVAKNVQKFCIAYRSPKLIRDSIQSQQVIP